MYPPEWKFLSVHSQACLFSSASHYPLQVCTGHALRGAAPLSGPDPAFDSNRERVVGRPRPSELTRRELPFCVNQIKTNSSHSQRLFPCFSAWRAAVGSQLADVVLSLWLVSHLHTVTASWLKLCSRISVVSVGGAGVFCIQEWLMMSSKDGRSAGRRDRHHLMRCWHSAGRTTEKV